MKKFYVTTAIDYANAAPHIGHAYEKLAADILARYMRLVGKDVFFLTGTDEHGIKVEKAASLAGMAAQTFVDINAEKFKEAWRSLLISNDYFIRTTEERHKNVVQKIFVKMRDKGDVYKGSYVGLYCEGCEDFLRERDLVNGKCPNHLKEPKEIKEENYFFRLSKYKDAIRAWLSSEGQNVKPDGRRQEVLNQLDDPELGDFSITRARSSLTWGIPVPDEPDQVIYVWIDALSNYITGVGYLTDDEMFQKWWPADLHVIGKDITKFHAIYWPAVLLSLEIPLPKLVFGHGFITVEGQKMSKSLGNVLDPIYLAKTYGADAIRYFLFAANSFTQDGDFSRKDMIATVNGHLANNLGNLLNRAITLLDKNFEGKIPAIEPDEALIELTRNASKNYHEFMGQLEFAKAIRSLLEVLDEANKYINDNKPWTLFKEAKLQEGGKVLVTSLNMLKSVAKLLSPITPKLSQDIWHQLGFDTELVLSEASISGVEEFIPVGQQVRNLGPVFQKLEDPDLTGTSPGKKSN